MINLSSISVIFLLSLISPSTSFSTGTANYITRKQIHKKRSSSLSSSSLPSHNENAREYLNNNKNRRQLLKALCIVVIPTTISTKSKAIEATDEITIKIPKSQLKENTQGLGIELSEVNFNNNKRVIVKSIKPNSMSDLNGIKPNYIFVSINNQSLERTDAKGVSMYFKRVLESDDDIVLTFRDPDKFREQLFDLEGSGGVATTQVAPAKVAAVHDQKVSVTQLKAPNKVCSHPADTNDLLEISYVGRVLPSGELFDSTTMKINGKEIPGRGGDVTIYFVLGKQPLGQFPPGWDVSLYGMCLGETRRIVIPPVLAYGDVGVPRRGIPPNATLQYDVTLISVNGLAVDNTPVYEKYNF